MDIIVNNTTNSLLNVSREVEYQASTEVLPFPALKT